MTEPSLNFSAKLAKCLLVTVVNKQRIVPKTLLPTHSLGNMTFAYSLKEMSLGFDAQP